MIVAIGLVVGAVAPHASAHPDHDGSEGKAAQLTPSPMRRLVMDVGEAIARWSPQTFEAATCSGGTAGAYPCEGADLLSHLSLSDLGATGSGNDVWGWIDDTSGRAFVLMGHSRGTAFVEVTDPQRPVYLGRLPSHTGSSPWRDIKVYDGHALVVSEAADHGMQVFELSTLLDVAAPPVTFGETAHYDGFGNAHNIVVDEESGFAYAVGTATCSGGLHMVDVRNPGAPTKAGCYGGDGYTHDAQCTVYRGPDADHRRRQICFAANEDTLTIVDVTNKKSPVLLSRKRYIGSGYAHQGWLTDDQAYFLLDDELDEWANGTPTRTYVWDVADLERPRLVGSHVAGTASTDHNQYIVGRYTFQANYRAGLRVLDLAAVADGDLAEVASFDVYPSSDGPGFNGAWSVYPWFDDGLVALSTIEGGLFLLRVATDRVHVHDLAPRAVDVDAGRWRAKVRVKVHNSAEDPVAGVLVTARFGARELQTCSTAADGKCVIKATLRDVRQRIKFEVLSLDSPGLAYDASANHDAVGNDGNGTRAWVYQ
jgi:choice-of-anchor B domain-containing protein